MVAHPHLEPIVVDSSRRRVVRYLTLLPIPARLACPQRCLAP